ncbi:MAG TPA: response regulator transcription factor [Candidatus Limnocylindria bacterium]|nr:response regulator transcription factor [Candidatus Limnocylindria bacterium]
MEPEPVRILVVDDDPGVASIVTRALSAEGYAVDTAASGGEALLLAARKPSLVVLDLLLPDLDGFDVCRELRRAVPGVAVLMLTARDAAADQIAGLDVGADDYMTKPFSLAVLAARVRALLRRREPSPPEILRVGDLALDPGAHLARRGDREIPLTKTEFRLLRELMRAPGRAIPKDELTKRVWGYDFTGDDNVLEVYVRYLRQKLERGGEPRLIQTLRGLGYALRPA